MPRRTRLSPAGIAQHVIQRGNNRQACFATDNDIAAYAGWLHAAAQKYDVAIHAWVFMTNHVHLLATPRREGAISSMMQYLGRYYVRYFNLTYQRTGTLWEGRFHSCLVQSERYVLACQRYIELNPVRAGMVSDPADYKWSSYRANGMGIDSKLILPHPSYEALGHSRLQRIRNYRKLFETELDQSLISDIRYTTNRGLVLGTERFKAEVAALSEQRTNPLPRGKGRERR